MRLKGKRALVTGSSRGIGRAIALALADEGADVAINYVEQRHAACEVVEALLSRRRRSFAVQADVSDARQIEGLFDRCRDEWGGLDIYVNNAIDVTSFGPVLEQRVDPWTHTLNSHVTTLLLSAQHAARLMRGHSGAIVAMSSIGSSHFIPGYAAVGVGKAAIEALTRYLAVELGREGVRVNTVSAGPIDTDALRAFPNYSTIADWCRRHLPMRRLGVPEDVAAVVAFLCTDEARWICGQTLVVDGGRSLLAETYG